MHYLGKKEEPYDFELWAISDALKVTIFTNIQNTVPKPGGLARRDLISQRASKLMTNGH